MPQGKFFSVVFGCPKGPKKLCLLWRKILFRRFSSFFRRLANVPNLNFCLGGIHKLRKRIFLGAFIKHWNFLYRADHTKFDLDKCKCSIPGWMGWVKKSQNLNYIMYEESVFTDFVFCLILLFPVVNLSDFSWGVLGKTC